MGIPSLEVRCLGPPSARVNGQEPPAEVLWRKHLALLAYLALSPARSRTRDHLLGLLWPESPEEKARRSLNEAVRTLRLALGNERLVSRGEAIEINPEGLQVDVRDFESLCTDGQMRALDLLRGDFLEGFHIDQSPAFDAWVESERARLRELAVGLLLARAEEQLAVTRYIEAVALARRALSLNPYAERAWSLGMRSAALDGDTAGALALYHEFAQRLERDLGEPPSAAITALAGRIREGKWQRARPGRSLPEPPLVGRRDAHARLFAALERPQGPAYVIIAGDQGSGRTRLLQASAERLRLAGAVVAGARILESDHDAPWSTLRALMRGGLLEAPGLAATDPLALRLLAGIVPDLAARVEPLVPNDAAQVADAVAALLRAVTEERPVGLFIDDAQWADGPTLAVLRAVGSRVRDAAITVVLTIAAGDEPSAELRALLAGIGRDISGAEVRLEPFTAEEIVALTEAMAPWCPVGVERERLARRVLHESGGNPFLAVTLLRDLGQTASQREGLLEWPDAGSTYEADLPITLPGVVRSVLVARAMKLDPDGLAVLRVASVAGGVLDPPLIADVSGLGRERVDAAFDRLERERFLVVEGERYAFNGRLLPAVIERECMQAGGRRRLRQQYISALDGRDDMDLQLLRARLMAVERHPDAFQAALCVAERATSLGATRTAEAAGRIAERTAGSEAERLALASLRRRAT